MSRAIRNVASGQIITVDQVSDVYGQHKQKVLDGMVDGRTWVFEDDTVEITADQAPNYLNEKLNELGKREEEVEKREAEIHTRFKEVVEKEIAYETKLSAIEVRETELQLSEQDLADRIGAWTVKEDAIKEQMKPSQGETKVKKTR